MDRPWSWFVLCDNEAFLRTRDSAAAHATANVILWSVPPRSPDLNPIEKFGLGCGTGCASGTLRICRRGGQLWGKTAFKARVRAICRSQHARRVAAACALGLRKVCLEAIAKKGVMARS